MATSMADIYNSVDVPGAQPDASTDGTDPGPAPSGYKPLSNKQRMDWNNFVRFLNKDKKLGGSEELDKKDKTLGLDAMQEYKKAHPDFSITPELVPHVQYEMQQLKNTQQVPGLEAALNPDVKSVIASQYSNRDVSPVDGWIGSMTSRQAYPEVGPFSTDPDKKYWGVDYKGASDYWNSNKNKK